MNLAGTVSSTLAETVRILKLYNLNSNNWLSFPLSPSHSSLPAQFHTTQPHHFSLGLVNDNLENPFQHSEWNVMNIPADSEVPKVADFLGVSKSEHRSDPVAFDEIQPSDSGYLFSNTSMIPIQNSSSVATSGSYKFQETARSNIQSLTLSMGSGKVSASETSGDKSTSVSVVEATPKRSLDTFGQRTSIYRGVTRHRWTGRYEAHLWDNSCRREGQSRKGRQVYLGGYDKEDKAARAYDLAALKYWGPSTTTNFPVSNYEKELDEMKHMTRQEFVAAIRRKSSGFSRGASMYRGVTRHHQHGRWQARIGRVAGNKDLYLGTFSTEEEAAEAYDIAAIKFRGLSAVTNFDMNRYDVKSILESNTLPIGGGAAKRLKEAEALESSRKREEIIALGSSFSYESSSSNRLQGYSLMQHHFDQPQPLLSLHSQEFTPYSHDPSFHHSNYIQTHLQLHQHNSGSNYLQHQPSHNAQLYNNFLQAHPALVQGLMNMGSSPSLIESSSGSTYNTDGFLGNTLGITSNSTVGTGNVGELAMVKVDYDDMPAGNYVGWSGDSVQGSGAGGVFTMWNE